MADAGAAQSLVGDSLAPARLAMETTGRVRPAGAHTHTHPHTSWPVLAAKVGGEHRSARGGLLAPRRADKREKCQRAADGSILRPALGCEGCRPAKALLEGGGEGGAKNVQVI